MDAERDRKTCVALDLKVVGANHELAQWLLDHPSYSNATVGRWLGCSEFRVRQLRKWARGGFSGTPFDMGITRNRQRDSIGRSKQPLKSLDNSESDLESDGDPGIADPAEVEDNVLYSLARISEHARVFRKAFKHSSFDREAEVTIMTAIDRMIDKWRSAQKVLKGGHENG